jgi:hypothetical protein
LRSTYYTGKLSAWFEARRAALHYRDVVLNLEYARRGIEHRATKELKSHARRPGADKVPAMNAKETRPKPTLTISIDDDVVGDPDPSPGDAVTQDAIVYIAPLDPETKRMVRTNLQNAYTSGDMENLEWVLNGNPYSIALEILKCTNIAQTCTAEDLVPTIKKWQLLKRGPVRRNKEKPTNG